MVIAKVVKEALRFKGHVGDLDMKEKNIIIYCDSQNIIHLTKNKCTSKEQNIC